VVSVGRGNLFCSYSEVGGGYDCYDTADRDHYDTVDRDSTADSTSTATRSGANGIFDRNRDRTAPHPRQHRDRIRDRNRDSTAPHLVLPSLGWLLRKS
jgi:hypothetical protein